MIKRVKVEQLKLGMYISDLNCGWLSHPFATNTIKLKKNETIEEIISHGIREVYIDTDKGLDVNDAPTIEEVHQEILTELTKVAGAETARKNTTSLKEELAAAKEIQKEARNVVQTLMNDIRLGKQLELEKADHVVEKIVGSISRNKDALTSLSRIKKTDEYTFYHSVSVSVLMVAFAKHLGLDTEVIKIIGIGGLLHDVGKMKVPVEILKKPDKLTEDEFKEIKMHAAHGRAILEQSPGINEISIYIAAQHHERLDGTGYPDGLKGDGISEFGKMAAIADVYDAITSDRCYHKGMQPSEALKKLFEWSRFHFDGVLVQQFIRCMGIYPVGTLVRLESGLLGIVLCHEENSLLHPTVRIIYDTKKATHIPPYDIDLSRPPDGVSGDKVNNYESPHKWNIRAEMYL